MDSHVGPIYGVPSTVGSAAKFTFGGVDAAKQRSRTVESSVDLLGVIVDNQKFKYPSAKGVLFGTDSKDNIRNATILRNHPQAFYGVHSPGPTLNGV